jgi:hypothetical protein
MIQSDRTHPGAVGQQYIGEGHHAVGYLPEPTMGASLCRPASSCSSGWNDVAGPRRAWGSEPRPYGSL